jgi:sulfite oxidase
MLSIQQYAMMTIHQYYPLNIAPSPDLIRQAFITPSERFFVRNHGSVPQVNAQRYRLSVTGKVDIPLELSLEDLRTFFPASSIMATLQCAGNRRDELASFQAIPGEIPWGAAAISNAVWRGVPLREVLLAAGVEPEARHVAFLGLDEVHRGGEQFTFGGSIPVEKALSPEVLLAYEMNGQSLSPQHGFPLRVVVPGYIGARSVKWLTSIILQKHPSTNYFQNHAYKLFPAHVQADTADWSQGEMLGALPLNSVICSPREGEILRAGRTLIQGYALTGAGRSIERVELSVDGGNTWTDARLLIQPDPWTWCFWEAILNLGPGTHQLIVRAWDSSGQTQPEDLSTVWNFKGYLNNAWHRITVFLQ